VVSRATPHTALLAALALTALAVGPALANDLAADTDCKDYVSQQDAQMALQEDQVDRSRLDADKDGQACEDYSGPWAKYPNGEVKTGPATSGQPDQTGALPYTGPASTLAPLAVVLALLGAASVYVGRHRARHARSQ
jgi:LPXTG-motif cell wall-anchored protein